MKKQEYVFGWRDKRKKEGSQTEKKEKENKFNKQKI